MHLPMFHLLLTLLLSCFVASFTTTRHNNHRLPTSHLLSTTVQNEETTKNDPVLSIPETKYKDLLTWLKNKDGAEVNPKLELRRSSRGDGYGAFVTDVVEKDEILFIVPRSACVTLDAVKNDVDCGETFKALIEKAGPGGITVAMAGYLAKEQLKNLHDEGSDLGPYLSTLPWERGVNTQEHILFWSDDEIESYLKGSFCYGEATELRGEVQLAKTVLKSIVGKTVLTHRNELSEPEFSWPWERKSATPEGPIEGLDEAVTGAFVCLLTRSFQDDGGNDDDSEKLVPLLDMLQHSENPNVRHLERKVDGIVEVKANRRLEAGEELLNQYRSEEEENMPYHRFFTRFGFIPGIMEPALNLLQDKSSIFYPQKKEV